MINRKYLILASAFLLLGCMSSGEEPSSDSNVKYSQEKVQEALANQEESGSFELPGDCYLNPFINCQGASLGNFLNAYYMVGDFDTFYAFINNSSQKRYGYEKIKTWFNLIKFGYEIEAVNIVDRFDDFGVIVYKTSINNTRGRLMLPFLIENDTAKLYLTNIDVGIEEQFYKGLPIEIDEFFTMAKKIENLEDITTDISSNKVVIRFDNILLFNSGEHQLNSAGKVLLDKLIAELKILKWKELKIECIGYADPDNYRKTVGNDIRNNLDLSVMRASTVAQLLVNSGAVKDKNCIATGVGAAKERYVDKSKSAKRRVEIILSY
jgi:flagellar motor protein MotB